MALAVSLPVTMAVPATALADEAPGTVPDITSPAPGSDVFTSPITVTATSTAAKVRFTLGAPEAVDTAIATVDGGVATAQLDAYGASGATTLRAVDCEIGESCSLVEDAISVNVSLPDPIITSPNQNAVVGSAVTVKANISGGSLQFFLDGDAKGKDLTAPFEKTISLRDKNDGTRTVAVQQCNDGGTVCHGGTDTVKVIKDTKGPRFTDVDSSLGTVFPVKDNYKDSVELSARVGERSLGTKVEIRKAGGPLVRTLNLGREDAGRLSVTWNGRKSNGDVVPKGKYLYRFVGTDVNGVVGKSGDKVVYVSDKKLVKKRVTRTLSAWGSKKDQFVGSCSSLTRVGSGTVGLRSNSKRQCTGRPSVVLTLHKLHVGKAIKYGSLRISTFGGRAQTRTGVALMYNVQKDGDLGPRTALRSSSKWYTGDQVNLSDYLIRGSVFWTVATANGFWYDVQAFRMTYTVSVLR